MDLHPANQAPQFVARRDCVVRSEQLYGPRSDEVINNMSRDSADRVIRLAVQTPSRHRFRCIVFVPPIPLLPKARLHWEPVGVEQNPVEQHAACPTDPPAAAPAVCGEDRVGGLEGWAVDDPDMPAWMDLPLVRDLAQVGSVAQQMPERTSAKATS